MIALILSYPTIKPNDGFEPPTFALQVRRSTTELIRHFWKWTVSIRLPLACKASDLPIDLHPQIKKNDTDEIRTRDPMGKRISSPAP